jgi:hypothetical protein
MGDAVTIAEHFLRVLEREAPSQMEERYAVLVATCSQSSGVCFCGCHISFVGDPTPEAAEERIRECIRSIPLRQLPGHVEVAGAVGSTTIGDSVRRVDKGLSSEKSGAFEELLALAQNHLAHISPSNPAHSVLEHLLQAVSLLAPVDPSIESATIPGQQIWLRFFFNGLNLGRMAVYPETQLGWPVRQALTAAGKRMMPMYHYLVCNAQGARLDPKLSVQALGLVNLQEVYVSLPTGHGG